MNTSEIYTRDQIDKLGNAFIYLAERINPLSKTKLLKLVYLIEEMSIRKHGIPFFGVEFQLWKLGPVVKDIFIDLSSDLSMFDKFISTSSDGKGIYISSNAVFSDDEFSDLDIKILDKAVSAYKDYTAAQLIEITHREDFPWHITAKNSGFLDLFEANITNSTDIVIDMSILLENKPKEKQFYLHTLEFINNSKILKSHHH